MQILDRFLSGRGTRRHHDVRAAKALVDPRAPDASTAERPRLSTDVAAKERAGLIISCGRTTNFFGNPARTVAFMEGVSGFSEDRGFQFLSSMETGGFVLSF